MKHLFTLIFLGSIWVSTAFGQYCIPTYSTGPTVGDSIVSFTLGTINGIFPGDPSGYNDYTAFSQTELVHNNTYTATIVNNPTFGSGVTVWIDYDQDSIFSPAELVGSVFLTAGQTGTITFTVPGTALLGKTRLRMLQNYNSILTDPCASTTWGETEDYSVNINQQLATDVGPVSFVLPDLDCAVFASGAPLTVQVGNFGLSDADTILMTYSVNGGALIQDTLFNLLSGQLTNFTFSTLLSGLTPSTPYNLEVYTTLSGDLNTANDTLLGTIFTPNVETLPYLENFESFTPGSPGSLANGWTRTGGTNFNGWLPENDGIQNTTGTGPIDDHTPGGAVYMYTEPGGAGSEYFLLSPCISLSGLTSPRLSFWYHMFGPTIDTLQVLVITGGMDTTIFTIAGQQQTAETDPWAEALVDLTPFVGDVVNVAFRSTANGFQGDIAIDDVAIYQPVPVDVGALEVLYPDGAGCYGSSEEIAVRIRNFGNAPIDFGVNNMTVGVDVAGAGTGNYSTTVTTGVLGVLDSLEVVVTTTADLSAVGAYDYTVYTSVVADTVLGNDTTMDVSETLPVFSGSNYFEDFETFISGQPGTLANGWTRENFTTGFGWFPEDDGVGNSTGTGPLDDHTPGGSRYMYTETSSGLVGNVMSLYSPCIDMAGTVDPRLSFWYHMFGADMGTLEVWIHSGLTDTMMFSLSGPQQTSEGEEWREGLVDLTPFVGSSIQVEFRGIRGASFTSDMAIDDVRIYTPAPIEGEILAIFPEGASCYTSAEDITVLMRNLGSQPLDFSTNNMVVNVDVSGASTQSFTTTVNTGIVPVLDSFLVTVTNAADLSATGFHIFNGNINIVGDTVPANDSLQNGAESLPIFTAPYFEDFETFVPGQPGSLANGWTRENFTTAFGWWPENDGVANSFGTGPLDDHTPGGQVYMYTETSSGAAGNVMSLFSPCLDLAGLTAPRLTFWYHMFGTDMGDLEVYANSGGNSTLIWSISGQQQTAETDPWEQGIADLSAFAGTAIQIEFRGIRGNGLTSDMAIDDVNVYDPPPFDVGAVAIAPEGTSCFITPDPAVVSIVNLGSQTLDFATNNVTVTLDIAGPVPQNYSATVTSGTLNVFDTLDVVVTTSANFLTGGLYNLTAYTTGDTIPINDTTEATVNAIPVYNGGLQEDFETFIPGSPGTFQNGWTRSGGIPTSNGWFVEEDGVTNSGGTGPIDDHTAGGSIYMYTETSSGALGDEFSLLSPCVNLASQQTPTLTFWYHRFGDDMGDMEVHIISGATDTMIWSISGQQQTAETDAWIDTTLDLTPFAGQLIQVEWRGYRGVSFEGDMAIDDINLFELLPQDGGIETVFAPQNGCALSANEDVVVALFNYGSDTIFSTDVYLEINGGAPIIQTFNDTLAPGAFVPFFFNNVDFSVPGNYDLKVWTGTIGDTNFFNDTTESTVSSIPVITTYPYYQDFESGDGGWVDYGEPTSSWEFGTPQKAIIQGASSGVNAWVSGGLTTIYPNNESSYVLGPCFDFTNLTNPFLEMDVWWDMQTGQDGAVLQTSIDDGLTWQNVGVAGDPFNWFNDPTVAANPGGQPEGWTGSPGSGGWVTARHALDNLGGQAAVQIRVAFATTAFTQDDGFAFDNVRVYDQQAEDFGALSFLSPGGNGCTGDSLAFEVTIINYGLAAQTGVPVTIEVTGPTGGTFTGSSLVSVAPNALDTVAIGGFVPTTPGFYYFQAYTGIAGDSTNFNDTTLLDSIEVFPTPDAPIAVGDSICSTDSATFMLTASSNLGDIFWYDAPTGGNVVHVGDTFNTPFLTTSTTYYAEAASGLVFRDFSPLDPSIGNGGNFVNPGVQALIFDVFSPVRIDSLTVFPNSDGDVVVRILDDASGAVVATTTVPVTGAAGSAVPIQIPVDLTVDPGTYRIDGDGTTTGGLWRNSSGANYPYNAGNVLSITNSTFSPAYYYYFYDWVVSVPGCSSPRIPVEANFLPPVAVDLGPDGVVCSGFELDAFSPDIVSYIWNNDPAVNTPSIIADTSGIYTVFVENAEGCTGADTVSLLVNPTPIVQLGPDTTECDAYVMDAGNPGATYFWTGPNPGGAPVDEQTFTAELSGQYTVTVTSLGCSSVDTIDVVINDAPAVDLGPDRGTCDPVTLDGGADGVSFDWSTGETTQMITVPAPVGGADTITVVVTGANGCVTEESVILMEGMPPVFDLGADTAACDSILLGAPAIPGATYNWSTGETTNEIYATTAGMISLTITDSVGCESTDDIMVDVQPTPVAAATFENNNWDFSINFINQSNPATGADYLWDFGDGNTSTDASPSHTYALPGDWLVTLIVANDCGSDTVEFIVGQVGIEDDLFGSAIFVYPNPTKDVVTISSQDLQAENLNIEVLDARGRSIMSHVQGQVFGAFSHSIDLTQQAEGIYMIKITDGERTTYKRVMRK